MTALKPSLVELRPVKGATWDACWRAAVRYAVKFDVNVKFTFNDKTYFVNCEKVFGLIEEM